MDGVVNEVPVPKIAPLNCAAYHLSVPELQPEPVNVTGPGPQRDPALPTGVDDGVPVTVNVMISL